MWSQLRERAAAASASAQTEAARMRERAAEAAAHAVDKASASATKAQAQAQDRAAGLREKVQLAAEGMSTESLRDGVNKFWEESLATELDLHDVAPRLLGTLSLKLVAAASCSS
jgi:vacuolar-type H+-ATPase subunit E/Vma4